MTNLGLLISTNPWSIRYSLVAFQAKFVVNSNRWMTPSRTMLLSLAWSSKFLHLGDQLLFLNFRLVDNNSIKITPSCFTFSANEDPCQVSWIQYQILTELSRSSISFVKFATSKVRNASTVYCQNQYHYWADNPLLPWSKQDNLKIFG